MTQVITRPCLLGTQPGCMLADKASITLPYSLCLYEVIELDQQPCDVGCIASSCKQDAITVEVH
jgi:hypothetical protein